MSRPEQLGMDGAGRGRSAPSFEVASIHLNEYDPAGHSHRPWPSVFMALREQLGLDLKPERAATEVLVIDRVTMPSEN